jgi:two-component system chemotaxis response regulator CheV
MTGMILIENNEFLFILDLEKILLDLESQSGQGNPLLMQQQQMMMVPAQAMLQQNQNAAPQGVSNGRVLLVDDSKLIIDGVKQALKNSGYAVVTANNGVEALSVLDASATDEEGIDIIITDIEMPQMDGMTFTRKLREHPIFSHLPVIFHSSLSGQASMSSAKSAGADGYVVKNDVKALVATLKRVLAQQSPAA